MEYIDILKTPGAEDKIDKIARELDTLPAIIIRGWPYNNINSGDVGDILSVYHELGLNGVVSYNDPDRRWYLACQIVARIIADRRDS